MMGPGVDMTKLAKTLSLASTVLCAATGALHLLLAFLYGSEGSGSAAHGSSVMSVVFFTLAVVVYCIYLSYCKEDGAEPAHDAASGEEPPAAQADGGDALLDSMAREQVEKTLRGLAVVRACKLVADAVIAAGFVLVFGGIVAELCNIDISWLASLTRGLVSDPQRCSAAGFLVLAVGSGGMAAAWSRELFLARRLRQLVPDDGDDSVG